MRKSFLCTAAGLTAAWRELDKMNSGLECINVFSCYKRHRNSIKYGIKSECEPWLQTRARMWTSYATVINLDKKTVGGGEVWEEPEVKKIFNVKSKRIFVVMQLESHASFVWGVYIVFHHHGPEPAKQMQLLKWLKFRSKKQTLRSCHFFKGSTYFLSPLWGKTKQLPSSEH